MNAIILHTGIARHNGDWNWQKVRSPFARIYYVVEGSAELIFQNNKICRLSPDHLYLVPPFTTHSNLCNGIFTHYYAHVYEAAESVSGLFEDYSFPYEVKAETQDEWLFKRLCLINSGKHLPQSDPQTYDNPATLLKSVTESHANRLSAKMESNGIINQLLARFLCEATSARSLYDTRIKQVRKFIRQNMHKTISIDTLAEMSCLSKDHLIRLFKSECGESPLQYINHRKIELAETKLITTNMTIKEISNSLGISDDSYFTRLFRKITGTTPAMYRKTAVKKK